MTPQGVEGDTGCHQQQLARAAREADCQADRLAVTGQGSASTLAPSLMPPPFGMKVKTLLAVETMALMAT